MIDWIEVIVPITHHQLIDGGLVQSFDDDGSMEWIKVKQLSIKGSYDTSIRMKSEGLTENGLPSHLFISGNPLKFFQGHNLFGMDDPVRLAANMASAACCEMGIIFTALDIRRWLNGELFFKRLDITYMYSVGTEERAAAFISGLAQSGTMRYRGRGEYTGSTLYFGKHSRRWSLKVYPKYPEITSKKRAHKLSPYLEPDQIEQLKEYAKGTVRFEIVIRSLELKRLTLDQGKWWTPQSARQFFLQLIEGLSMAENVKLPPEDAMKIPQHLQLTYMHWKDGHDVKQSMAKRTYYRQRKELLNFGIDIGVPCENPDRESNVVPIRPVIEAKPLAVPDWAKGTDLFYDVK